jgi:hypothetical protein
VHFARRARLAKVNYASQSKLSITRGQSQAARSGIRPAAHDPNIASADITAKITA